MFVYREVIIGIEKIRFLTFKVSITIDFHKLGVLRNADYNSFLIENTLLNVIVAKVHFTNCII